MNEEENQVAKENTPSDDWDDIAVDADDIVDEDNLEVPEETDPQTEEANQAEPPEVDTEKEPPKTEETKETDQFVLKHLGEEKTVSRDEIVPLAQKGMDYDRVKEKLDEQQGEFSALKAEKETSDVCIAEILELAKLSGYKNIEELVDETRAALMAERENTDISIARGKVALDRKEKAISARESALAKPPVTKAEPDIGLSDFVKAFPNVKAETIPPEVWQEVKLGIKLPDAYGRWTDKQALTELSAENEKLKAQIAAEKKAAENKGKTTGSRQSVGKTTPKSDFEKLWEEE